MSTYKSSYNKRKKVNFKLISALFALVGVVGTITLGTMNFTASKKMSKVKENIETIKQEKANIEQQIPTLESSIKELGKEVDSLQNIIWKYQPVIIPESMK